MEQLLKEKLDLCRKKLSADALRKSNGWQGYEVYIPVYKQEYVGGFPKIVLVKDGGARLSTHEECFEYMNFIKKI